MYKVLMTYLYPSATDNIISEESKTEDKQDVLEKVEDLPKVYRSRVLAAAANMDKIETGELDLSPEAKSTEIKAASTGRVKLLQAKFTG